MHLLFQTTRPLGPETGAGDDDDVGLVGQAIQTCRGQQGGSEQVGPLLQGAVTGEHNATPLVPLVDDVVEVLGGRRVQRLEPEVVQHQQVRAEVGLEAPLQGAISAAAVDVLEHAVGIDEQGRMTLGEKPTGQPSAGNPHAGLDEAGAGNVAMGAGLRSTTKDVEKPPGPKVRAPALDPTGGGLLEKCLFG